MHNVFVEKSENESKKIGDDFIRKLFERRNTIAHQNDRSHDSAIQNDIDKDYVEYNIETMKKIAHEIYVIANAK